MSSYIATHPDNLGLLRETSRGIASKLDGFLGIPIHTYRFMPRFVSRYQPPKERFFEYDKSSEDWLRYFGYGHMQETDEPLFLQFNELHNFGTQAMEPLARIRSYP